ncbi:MAG: hypothetical protein AB7N90_02620 [Vicinamibacterales bacterium]
MHEHGVAGRVVPGMLVEAVGDQARQGMPGVVPEEQEWRAGGRDGAVAPAPDWPGAGRVQQFDAGGRDRLSAEGGAAAAAARRRDVTRQDDGDGGPGRHDQA